MLRERERERESCILKGHQIFMLESTRCGMVGHHAREYPEACIVIGAGMFWMWPIESPN